MEEYLPLIRHLLSGAVGGNLAGTIMKNLSLGTAGNSIVGILGGGLGGFLLSMLGLSGAESVDASTSLDIGNILGNVAGGGVGGGALMAIVGILKKALNK